MRLVLTGAWRAGTSPDMEDVDKRTEDDSHVNLKLFTVVRDADAWTLVPIKERTTNNKELDIWAIDELHAFQMWLAYRRGEYTKIRAGAASAREL